MNIRDLHYIVAVAKYKHFGKAADACYVSQPALSAQIKKLEEELNVQIFERSNKKVFVTTIGKKIITQAHVILDEVEGMKELAKSVTKPMSGVFKIGLIPTVAPYLLPHIIPGIHKKYPDLEPHLREGKTDELVAALRAGELDTIIAAHPIDDINLDSHELYEEPFLIALPKQHSLEKKAKLRLSDIEDESIMLLEEGHCLRKQALQVCQFSHAREQTALQATSLETLRLMVVSGIGITLLPLLSVLGSFKQCNCNLITLKHFKDPEPTREIAMFWREHSARAGCCLTLAKMIQSKIGTLLLKSQS